MNEQRAFTVAVNRCEVCPYARHARKYCNIPMTSFGAEKVYAENLIAITKTCPMWNEAKPIGELKCLD
jgi:hypothetical protein